ncbi:hypothetical protein [Chryseobacterium nepalense]|uniref:hypothetical protein n=1 Tax=Chryseobacterium nepalense TaxID=1854498 RepID=UPI002E021E7C|nr:hypothetical protein [Chryseobacterium nepalense]
MEKEVSEFLNEFKIKLGIWDVLYRDDRGKNTQALADLEITPIYRGQVLKELNIEDYSEGPLQEKLYGGADMWVFGKIIKNQEVYIKISFGAPGASVLCISFHVAEHKMNFPLKK